MHTARDSLITTACLMLPPHHLQTTVRLSSQGQWPANFPHKIAPGQHALAAVEEHAEQGASLHSMKLYMKYLRGWEFTAPVQMVRSSGGQHRGSTWAQHDRQTVAKLTVQVPGTLSGVRLPSLRLLLPATITP
jgi:hypothetical protein